MTFQSTGVSPKTTANRRGFKLLEIVNVGTESFGDDAPAPLQLFKFSGAKCDEDSVLWVLSSLDGSTKIDAYMMSLLQKALSRDLFNLYSDVYLTPVMNPMGLIKGNSKTANGEEFLNNFAAASSLESKTLSRWAKLTKPKAIVTFSAGPQSLIRHKNFPTAIIEKLTEICEIPSCHFGEEPEFKNEQGEVIPYKNLEGSFGAWCIEQGIAWLDFHLTEAKRSFEEIAQHDWKMSIGPALKWLLEGPRFNPPKEEPVLPKLQVIPVLEMPPEFANL